MPALDTPHVRERILGWLARSAPGEETLRDVYKRPRPGTEKALISVEPDGVRANLGAVWWRGEGPLLTISVLALLHVPLLNGEKIVAWIKGQQHEDGTIHKGRLGATPRAATYAACVLLRLLGAELDEEAWQRTRLVTLLREQQPGAGRPVAFLPADLKSRYAELEVVNCWIGSLTALGKPPADRDGVVRYIQAMQAADSSFALGRVQAIPYGWEQATRDAVRSLALLGAVPLDRAGCVADLQLWQGDDGGFSPIWVRSADAPVPSAGRTSRLNVSAWAMIALYLLDAEPLDREAALRNVISR
jgi:hypothetical protein